MFQKISLNYDNLSKVEKKIADYYLSNAQDIIQMNIHEVSEKLGVSSASISRFSNEVLKMSFAESKIELARSKPEPKMQNRKEILEWATDLEMVPSRIVTNIEEVCNNVISLNETKQIQACIDLLANAQSVYFFGVGSSGLIAQDFQQKLSKLGIRTFLMLDSNFAMLNSNNCAKGDVVISISYSGKVKSVIVATENAKKNGSKIITLTSNTKNPIRSLADVSVVVPNVENESRLSAIFSRYGDLFLVDTIFIGLAKTVSNDPEKAVQDYRTLTKYIKEA